MKSLALFLVLALLVLLVGLMVSLLVSGWRRHHGNRFRIMANGIAARATITSIQPARRSGATVIGFSFSPESGAREIAGRQRTTQAAVDVLHLQVGSSLEVRFIPGQPRRAFSDTLLRAERAAELRNASVPADEDGARFHVSYSDPAIRIESTRANNLRWYGAGELAFTARTIRFRPRQPFYRGPAERVFSLDSVVDVEQLGPVIRLHLLVKGKPSKRLQLWALNPSEAAQIAQRLPVTRSARFAPTLAEGTAFAATLLAVTPNAPVTPTLIGLNVLMFAIATALGGGFLVPDPAVMIRLGTDYTPLTLGGQWWRLLSCMFLHFGLLHLLFNMSALLINGTVAERLYGSGRYLLIYLVAGLGGSLASLLWHPTVNGAGASGAIFGLLGALIAFFLVRRQDLPPSVFKAQLTSATAFVGYNLLIGARGGIDNAAHIGGLAGGFLMGCLLAQPLSAERHARRWTAQWTLAAAAVTGATLLVASLLSSGRLAPRALHDARGRTVPREGLVIAPRSVRGIALGMSAAQLLAAKGPPYHKTSAREWVYNTVDAKHDGVLVVRFGRPGTPRAGVVDLIEYSGDFESAPAELPFLKTLSATDLIQKYGEPASRVAVDGGTTFFWFRNGILAGIRDGTVYRYGIFDEAMVGD